jgi:hypothetical protein
MSLSRPNWRLILFIAAAVPYLAPVLVHWGQVGRYDFDQIAVFNQIALWWYGLGDFSSTWNPFLCGGATLVGNPQIPISHVNLPLYALFGPVNGMLVAMLLWMTLGYWGMYRFARSYGVDRAYSSLAACAWVLNGFFVGNMGNMHIITAACFPIPLLFFLNRRLVETNDPKHLALSIASLFLLSVANHHFLTYNFIFIPLHFLAEARFGTHRASGKTIAGYLLGTVLILGGMAHFIVPAMAWSRDFPRYMPIHFENPLQLFGGLLFPGPIFNFERTDPSHNYYFLIGPVLFWFLVKDGFRLLARKRDLRPLMIVCAVAFLLALGSFRSRGSPIPSPFDLIKIYIPGFKAVRVPSRYFFNAVPGFLLASVLALKAWLTPKKPEPKTLALWFAAVLIPLWAFCTWHWWARAYKGGPFYTYERKENYVSNRFQWVDTDAGGMLKAIAPDTGVRNCYEALEIPRAPGLSLDKGLLVSAPEDALLTRSSWSRMRVAFDRPLRRGAELVFNFNHHSGWKSDGEGGAASVVSTSGELLRVKAERGVGAFSLRYEDHSWGLGLRISAVFWLLLAAFLTVALRTKTRRKAGNGYYA